MVGVSGVRGRVGDPLIPELVTGLAAAFGAFMRLEGGSGPTYVGRDSRISGPMFSRAVISGLQSVGVAFEQAGKGQVILGQEHDLAQRDQVLHGQLLA